jgi:hypothetical protein
MNKIPTIPWWSPMGLCRSRAAPDTDYADMGTAFGLDASLSRAPASDDQAALAPGDAGPSVDRLNRRSVI